MIERTKPDSICIGVEFVPKKIDEYQNRQLCTNVYDPDIKDSIFVSDNSEKAFLFASIIRREYNIPVFFSSNCDISNDSDCKCILKLFNNDIRYCLDCKLYHQE